MARKKRFAPNDNNLAIAYYRFSSHSQNDASIDQQRDLAHEWADAHGFKIVQEYEDAAISGTTDARPGFQQMLSEVAKIRPHTLIMWKTDRLGRDKYVLAMAKKKIRDAGCEIHLLAEHIPTEGPEGVLIEGLMEAMAEYYSRQLSQNIQRGMDYNAQHALYNGHKLFGYDVDRSTKKYIPDPNTAPFVQWAFGEYASGKPLKTIAEEMNAQGLRTPRNAKFSVNMLNKMLKNRAYIGEYHHGDITVAGGMPVLVDEATFDRAQRRFAENKRKGSQRAHGMDDAEAPRYWLTGKLYCGECGSTMQGVSGTSKTGRKYYYYYCSAQRRKECHLHKARKQDLEDMVLFALHNIVDDEENVVALALDAAEYYEKSHNDTAYLEALEAKRREVEKSLANLVKVIEKGVVSDAVTERLTQLEEQKSALNDAIGTENVRVSLCEDRHSIQAYFDKFLHADVNDPEIRDQVFEYFVDKVYLYDDKLVVSMWFSEDDKQEITWRDWFSLDEYWTDESPFVKGGGVEFDCFPLGSTKQVLDEHLFLQRRLRREMFALIHNRKAPSWEETRDGAFSRYSYKAKPVSLPRRASVRHADYVGMFSAHDSTGAVAADQLIHLIRRRKVEVKFDRVLQAGGTEAVTETAASVTDAQTAFTFTDSGITVEGSSDGYECNGTVLTIDAAGTYLLSGSCTDGSVKIKKGTTGVRLILSGLSLTSADTAPITCNKSSEVVIVAADGTENVLTDAAANNDESNSGNENAENAVIKCKDGSAVTLCGAGTLTLNAYGKNGIKSGATTAEEGEASLTIRELTLNINASVNDAINAEQYLAVESGTLNLATADVALHCDLIMDIGAEGTDGPTIAIAEACEGIEAAALSIRSGDISIVCTDDCLNAANSDLANYDFAINISGGTIVAYTTAGDGFDSNGSLTISGGSAGMGMNLSTTQAYVTFGSAGISGTGNMGGQPGSFGGMQPPQNGGQPKSDSKVSGNFQPSDDFRPGDMTSNNISAATATAQAGSDNSSGNAI